MKVFRSKKSIMVIIVLLVTTVFSALGLSLVSIVGYFNIKQTQSSREASAWDGEGTFSNPYKIKSAEDLKELSKKVAGGTNYRGTYFKLINDIDYGGADFMPIGAELGTNNKYTIGVFSGIFDGNGHKVSNMKTNLTINSYVPQYGGMEFSYAKALPSFGFFAAIGMSSPGGPPTSNQTYETCVKNLKIEDYEIKSSIPAYAGGICGVSITGFRENVSSPYSKLYHSVKIENCLIEGLKVDIVANNAGSAAGGIVGFSISLSFYSENTIDEFSRLTIRNCMVLDIGKFEVKPEGLKSVITPGYGLLASLRGVNLTACKDFGYYYYIYQCVTDNTMYDTVQGSSSYVKNLYMCNKKELKNEYNYFLYHDDCEKIYRIHNKPGDVSPSSWEYGSPENSNVGDLSWGIDKFNDNKPWFSVSSTSKYVYLRSFMEIKTVRTIDPSVGIVEHISINLASDSVKTIKENEEYQIVVPKDTYYGPDADDEGVVGGRTLLIWQWKSGSTVDEMYEFKCSLIPDYGYEFDGWKCNSTSFDATFASTALSVTFLDVEGTSNTADKETYILDKSYTIYISISYTQYAKEGAYKTCTFRFTEMGKNTHTTVEYTLSNNSSKYISGGKGNYGSGEFDITNSWISPTDDISLSVALSDKTYSTSFN